MRIFGSDDALMFPPLMVPPHQTLEQRLEHIPKAIEAEDMGVTFTLTPDGQPAPSSYADLVVGFGIRTHVI